MKISLTPIIIIFDKFQVFLYVCVFYCCDFPVNNISLYHTMNLIFKHMFELFVQCNGFTWYFLDETVQINECKY